MKTWAVAALALGIGVTAGALQAELTPSTIEQIKTLWQSQHKALDAHDIEGVLATYSDAADIMLMGTGPGEHWVGRDEVKDAYVHFMEDFDPNTMQVECGDGAGSVRGDVLWFTGVCQFSDKKTDAPRQYVVNLSAVVVKQDDDWRFQSLHFSHLTDAADAAAPATD